MVKVAVAGAGSLGTQIVERIFQEKKHDVVVLSRKPRPDLIEQGIQVSIVDYSKHDVLVAALEGVHTVLSVHFIPDKTLFVSTQIALLNAAKDAGVKRFSPSEYAYSEAASSVIGVYHPKVEVWKAVKESGLQYTAFRAGIYLDYLAHGSTKPGVNEKAFKVIPSWAVWILDISKGEADIPGTGDEKVSFTATGDIAGFVAEGLDIEWTEETGFAGTVTTYNELVKIAEKVTGKKIQVRYHSIEDLEKQAKEDTPYAYFKEFHIAIAKGLAYVEPTLNKKTGYKPVTAEEFIREWWA